MMPRWTVWFLVRMILLILLSLPILVLAHAVPVATAQEPSEPTSEPDWQHAERLFREGEVLFEQGEYQRALTRINQALALYRRAGDREGEAMAFYSMGLIYARQGYSSQAVEPYRQALAIMREVGNRAGEGQVLYQLGLIQTNVGLFNAAEERFAQALAIAREIGDRTSEAAVLKAQARVLETATRLNIGSGVIRDERSKDDLLAEALQLYTQALEIYRSSNDALGEIDTLLWMGTLHANARDLDTATEYFTAALDLSRTTKDDRGIATSLRYLGGVHQSRGRLEQALDYFQEALAIQRTSGDLEGAAASLADIAYVYAILDQPTDALAFYQHALTLTRQAGTPTTEAELLSAVGATYEQLTQYARALEYYQQALDIWTELHNSASQAYTSARMGVMYQRLGQYEQALDALRRAQAFRDTLRYEPKHINAIGIVYFEQGNLDEAMARFDVAQRLAYENADFLNMAIAVNYKGLALAQEGEHEEAIRMYGIAMANANQQRAFEERSTIMFNQAVSYEQLGDSAAALEAYRQAIEIREQFRTLVGLEEFKTTVADHTSEAYRRAIDLSMQLGQPENAFDFSERARARNLLDQLAGQPLSVRASADTQLVEAEQALLQEIAALKNELQREHNQFGEYDPERIQELSEAIAAKGAELDELVIKLKLSNPEYAALHSVDPLGISDIQALLDAETTLVSYFVTEESVYVFVLAQSLFEVVELPITDSDLRASITNFRLFSNLAADPPVKSRELYDQLIAPVKPYLTTPLVGIVPHTVLHYLPFTALTDGETYLGDEYTLFVLPNASILQFLQPEPSPVDPSVLVMAQGQAENLPALPYVDEEAHTIADLYQTVALTSTAATESAFRTQASNHQIVHIAAHGQMDANQPLLSSLALAPDDTTDGLLEVREIYELDLRHADLVVLSACETHLGSASRGDDIVGFHRAFLYAGTPTIITSLWSVDDQATHTLMTAFYTYLRQGAGKAQALQAAQADVRSIPIYANPYYWAGFVLTGHPGEIAPITLTQPASVTLPEIVDEDDTVQMGSVYMIGGLILTCIVIGTGLTIWLYRRQR